MKILITGIAGSGKTTISAKLNRLGYDSTDLDRNGICAWNYFPHEALKGLSPREMVLEYENLHGKKK